jgi:hypothetical protein
MGKTGLSCRTGGLAISWEEGQICKMKENLFLSNEKFKFL